MKRSVNHLTKMALALAAIAAALGIAVPAEARDSSASAKISVTEFRNTMRKLWEDHITWTRLYIVSAAANLPDKAQTAERLLQNQVDIGNGIKPFFGEAAGARLTALLKDHILGAADLIATAQAGDKASIGAASAKWYSNGDEIAAFLSGADPEHWPPAGMKSEMRMHLDLTLAEATARLHGNFAEDIHKYDEIHQHILNMADLLSNGIVAKFPDRFDRGR
jgi:hypothetical protein